MIIYLLLFVEVILIHVPIFSKSSFCQEFRIFLSSNRFSRVKSPHISSSLCCQIYFSCLPEDIEKSSKEVLKGYSFNLIIPDSFFFTFCLYLVSGLFLVLLFLNAPTNFFNPDSPKHNNLINRRFFSRGLPCLFPFPQKGKI